jgi:hypothetical protein
MSDLAAHVPAVLCQYGRYEEAEAVHELYAAVRRLRSAKPEPLIHDAIWKAGWALQRFDASERDRLGQEDYEEMELWLSSLATAYEQALGFLSDLDERVKQGGNPNADVSGEHGALATLLGGLFD